MHIGSSYKCIVRAGLLILIIFLTISHPSLHFFSHFYKKINEALSLKQIIMHTKATNEIIKPANILNCGIVNTAMPLITNGKDAKYGDWPWHVAVYALEAATFTYRCGGNLIDKDHVITAAHCVTKLGTNVKRNEEEFLLHFGITALNQVHPEFQERSVDLITVHPNYSSIYYHNDLAILKLTASVARTVFVGSVCLWNKALNFSLEGRIGSVVGWGLEKNHELSIRLQEILMPVVDTSTCVLSKPDFFSKFTSNKTFCAGFKNGSSVCNGDSGGGMFFQQESGSGKVWYLRGIVSVSLASQRKYCDPYNYVVFTDLATHLDWLNSVLRGSAL